MNASSKFIEIQGVEQSFKTAKGLFPALRGIDLTIARGEFVSLIGHSGCGKSTLLNLIAGLTTPTTGVLLCANKEIKGPGPERAVVFQNHSLLPWLTCEGNIHLAVERVYGRTESRAQLKARTLAALELVGLAHLADRYPAQISQDGGRRTALELLAFPTAVPEMFAAVCEEFGVLDTDVQQQIRNDVLYAQFELRQSADALALKRDEAMIIPADFDYGSLSGLSGELTQKLLRTKPTNIAQASRIEGMTPAALILILSRLRKAQALRAAS